jgi:uncharacterized protein
MPKLLNDVEVRVLGALVEKQVTTPEQYPLTLHALTLACNQKSNRHPVVAFDETTVAEAIESLRAKNLAYVFYGSTSRVPKYKHVMTEIFGLSQPELAVMCLLMLRGPQTAGELRGRSERLYEFSSPEEVEAALSSLLVKEPEPLVAKMARQPGQKEARYAHLLTGEISFDEQPAEQETATRSAGQTAAERYARLEQEVATLREQLEHLQQEFVAFRKQFD